MANKNIHDVIIVGGGPAGSTAALYTSRASLNTLVLDKAMSSGALGSTSKIANYPGFSENIKGSKLLLKMQEQAKQFGAIYQKATVVGVDFSREKTKNIFTNDGQTYTGKTIILATGAMGRSNILPGEDAYLGKGVSYCATCDGAFFKDKEVLVYGKDDFAIEEALFLTRFVKKLYFVTPKDSSKEIINNEKVILLKNSSLIEVIGDNNKVTSAVILSQKDKKTVKVDGIFIYGSGNKPVTDYLYDTIKIDSNSSCIIIDKEYQTNVPGIFACGDVVNTEIRQVIIAAAQGCSAALAVDKWINKREQFTKDYR